MDVAVLAGDRGGELAVGGEALLEALQEIRFTPDVIVLPSAFVALLLEVILGLEFGRENHNGKNEFGSDDATEQEFC